VSECCSGLNVFTQLRCVELIGFELLQSELMAMYTPEWLEDDATEYESDAMVSMVTTRFARASSARVPSLGTIAAAVSNSHSTENRYLQLIHGELANSSGALRIISNVIGGGGTRGKVKESLEALLNTAAESDESDSDVEVVKSKKGRKRAVSASASTGRHLKMEIDDDDDEGDDEEADEEMADDSLTQAPTQPVPTLKSEMAAASASSSAPAASSSRSKGKKHLGGSKRR